MLNPSLSLTISLFLSDFFHTYLKVRILSDPLQKVYTTENSWVLKSGKVDGTETELEFDAHKQANAFLWNFVLIS
jgi:hypothetical protein